jgi:hypothetical protein
MTTEPLIESSARPGALLTPAVRREIYTSMVLDRRAAPAAGPCSGGLEELSGACEPVAATGGGVGRRADSRVASAAVRAASPLDPLSDMGRATHLGQRRSPAGATMGGATCERCIAAPMASGGIARDGGGMPAFTQHARSCRRTAHDAPSLDPAHELYDRASAALNSTQQLAVASARPGSAAAVAPALQMRRDFAESARARSRRYVPGGRAGGRTSSCCCGPTRRRAIVVHDRFVVASDAVCGACAIGVGAA